MTPTPQQLADTLPRCSAGLDGGDWTDDDDRLAWATKVLELYDAAWNALVPPKPETGIHAMSCAILRAAGIDPDQVRAVSYEHSVGEAPVLMIEHLVVNPDTRHFDAVQQRWVIADERPDWPPPDPRDRIQKPTWADFARAMRGDNDR